MMLVESGLTDDVVRILGHLPCDIITLLQREKEFCYLAGGYIRAVIANEEPDDIDLIVQSKADAWRFARQLSESRYPALYSTLGSDAANRRWLFETRNAITVISPAGRLPVQFIYRWKYNNPEALLASFDFTIAQAAFVWRTPRSLHQPRWELLVAPLFYQDLTAKRLRYTQPEREEDEAGSLLRVLKFVKRGYHCAPEELGKVVARLVCKASKRGEFNLNCPEKALALELIQSMRRVDPLRIIDRSEPSEDSMDKTDFEEPKQSSLTNERETAD